MMSIAVTILSLVVTIQIFVFAYLRKINSPRLNKGAFRLPAFATFGRLLGFGLLTSVIFTVRVYSEIFM